VPDLIVWNVEYKMCRFVEVKGPGDKPSDSQKVPTIFYGASVLVPDTFA
jgi:hypothetical protein